MIRKTLYFYGLIFSVMVLTLLSACRNDPDITQPEVIVTVLSATPEPTSTAVPAETPRTEVSPTETPSVVDVVAVPSPTSAAAPTAVAFSPGVVAYNLGEATLVQDRFAEDSRFRNMPARLEGIIAVPDGLDHPAPVVLILHGNHHGCPVNPNNTDVDLWPCPAEDEQPNFQGFDYLAGALAEEGYVALAININAEYSIGFGEPTPGERLNQLIRYHLGALETAAQGGANEFGVELAGRADLSRIALIGHSQGGEFANRLTHEQGWDSPYALADNGFGPVDGLLLVAPSFNFVGSDGGRVPLAVLLPQCDGDVVQQVGQFYFEALRVDSAFESWATTAVVNGANHNFFNRILGPDTRAPVDCPSPLSPDEQQAFLVDYATTFLRTIWSSQPDQLAALAALGLDVTTTAASTIANADVATVSTVPERLQLLVPADDQDVEDMLSSGRLRLDNISSIFCRAGFDFDLDMSLLQACRRPNYTQPGQPSQLLLNWTNPNAAVRLALPDDARDISKFTALSLRTAIDPLSELNQPDQPQSFSVEIVDSAGQVARVVIPEENPALQFPAGEASTSEFFADGIWSGNVHMSDVRIPLSEFEGIDLSDVVEVRLAFDQTDSGALFLADVQFVRPSAAVGANSTLLTNANGENDALKAIGRFRGTSACTATFIDTGGSADSSAYVITNGHCAQPWDANEVFHNLPGDELSMTFNYFADTVEQAVTVPVSQVAYSTMKGRDVAIVELDITIGELLARDIVPLALADDLPELPFAMQVIGAPVSGVPSELAFLREETCLATASANLFEFIWHFDDAIRNGCQDIYGGSSGSPVFAADQQGILALINTTSIGGSSPCAAGVPCEVHSGGTDLLVDTSYATPVVGLAGCFANGVFDLALSACPLDDGRQLTLSGYPPQPILPTSTGTNGQSVDASWNTAVSGNLPYYRYKTGPAGLTDCRTDADYSEVIALSNQQLIDDMLPAEEGSYVLCVVAGPSPSVDSTWQPVEWATVVRAEIDTTPPNREPFINIIYLGDRVSIEPIFSNPELVDFRLKVGPTDTTDCVSDSDYLPYRRIPIQVSIDDLPVKVCVIGSDSAGNEGKPVERIVAPRQY